MLFYFVSIPGFLFFLQGSLEVSSTVVFLGFTSFSLGFYGASATVYSCIYFGWFVDTRATNRLHVPCSIEVDEHILYGIGSYFHFDLSG